MWDNPDGGSMTESHQDPLVSGAHIPVRSRFPGRVFPASRASMGPKNPKVTKRVSGRRGREEVSAETERRRFQGFQGNLNHKGKRIRGKSSM